MRHVGVISLLLAVVVACGGGAARVEGVVVDVDGGLTGVESFEIVAEGGDRYRFEPAPDLESFEHGGPLSHLNEHLQTGSSVRVTYRDEGGRLVAIAVDDA